MSEQRKKVGRFFRSVVYGGIFFMFAYISSLPIFSKNFSDEAPVIPSANADVISDSPGDSSPSPSPACDGSPAPDGDCGPP